MSYEDWPEHDSDTIFCECDRCGNKKPCQPVIDPFVREGITEDSEKREYWCKPCYDLRSGDV
jgi:hypothetical protein